MSLGTALAWAVGVICFRKAAAQWSPVALNVFKNTVALVLLAVSWALAGEIWPRLAPTDWLLLAVSGVLGIAVADTLFLAALDRIGAGLVAVVDTLYAPTVIVLSVAFLGERLGGQTLAGAALVVGAVLLGTSDRPPPGHSRATIAIGVVIGAAAIGCMSLGIVLAKPVLERVPVLWATQARMFFGTVALLPLLASARQRAQIAAAFRPSPVWRSALPGSVVGCYLSSVLWIGGMKWTLASVAATLNQMSSIFIFVLAGIFLGEPMTPRRVLAVTAATLGAVLVAFR
jgi:drug/metabolite transporter (DMT)-like permease